MVVGAIPLVLDDLHGRCGGVLGRNGMLLGVPARLQRLTGRPLGTWACQIVEPHARAQQSGVHLMFKTVLLHARLNRFT